VQPKTKDETGEKFILSGDFTLSISSANNIDFLANINTVTTEGQKSHTHEFTNFRSSSETVNLNLNSPRISITGTMDVGVNKTVKWSNVRTEILISSGRVISITLDHVATENHFVGQDVYGITT